MYPHERSLVKRLADEPFALIGVNSDADKKKLRPRMIEGAKKKAPLATSRLAIRRLSRSRSASSSSLPWGR